MAGNASPGSLWLSVSRETMADSLTHRSRAITSDQTCRMERFLHETRVVRGTGLMEMKLSGMEPTSVEPFFYPRSEAGATQGEA